MPSPHPPIPRDTVRSGALLSRHVIIWIAGISLAVSAMVWLALWQIKAIAEDNAPTPAQTAQCIANLDPAREVDSEEACPSGANVVLAARHPLRNAAVVFVLLFAAGYGAVLLNRQLRR